MRAHRHGPIALIRQVAKIISGATHVVQITIADESPLVAAEIVIDLRGNLLQRIGGDGGDAQVVYQARQVRLRPVRSGGRAYGIDEIRRNHVARKRRADVISGAIGGCSRAEGVVNNFQASGRIEVLGKVPRSLSGGGHGEEAEPARVVAISFEQPKEKRLVLDDGPADRAAILVYMQGGNLRPGPVGKEAIGVQVVVLQELESITVKTVGPRLSDHGGDSPATPAVTGRVAIGLHTHLIDGIHRWQHGQAHDAWNITLVQDGDTVLLKIGGRFQPSIKGISNGTGEKVARIIVWSGRLDSRFNGHQYKDVSVRDGQIDNRCVVHDSAKRGVRRVDHLD